MKLIHNSGSDRVIDLIRPHLKPGHQFSCITPSFSLFAFAELRDALAKLERVQLILPPADDGLAFLGGESDRAARNRLQSRWLSNQCAKWLEGKVELRRAHGRIPQGAAVMRAPDGTADRVVLGSFEFSTDGLGLTPGNPLSLIQASESPDEATQLARWLDQQWSALQAQHDSRQALIQALRGMGQHRAPLTLYALILNHLFGNRGDEMDEERIVKSATGIRNTVIWNKLFRFQRDGVIGAIDKLARFGGCIIADSVGLGKTFEALAVIKYHELRNDRVLVLAPKRLRDNWTLYKANDKRNVLAADRFNYDVLNHTDLSRDGGHSGDIDLNQVNWGNYDLVVIDESHNFRNKASNKGKETRYDRLMRRIIKEGVKTRVLMLSATPVNNRLADLKNQIAFVTEGDDTALVEHGIDSIEQTTRKAQIQFNRWLEMDEAERTPGRLVEMLGFDYFTLLDHLTIARSRRHVEKYYGTAETGKFPGRLPPINIKADVDLAGQFRAIKDINLEIRRLNLASYAPLRYVLPHKRAAYDAKYSTEIRGGESFFRQADREESLIHLLRVNVLKRMESAVSSFSLTVHRQLKDVEAVLAHIENHDEGIQEIDIADVDIDDPSFESLLVGRKVKVLLSDVDLVRWKQDLVEDRNRLATLLAAAQQVSAERDAKLAKLRDMIEHKCRHPINTGNRKIIVFTAFSDTAQYLYANLAPWVKAVLGIDAGLVTGSDGIQTTLPGLRKSMSSVLSAFAPRAKERPVDMAAEGEIDLLIATDCISEGQNLQDCDWLVNYDIHWNPVRIIQRFGRVDRIGSPNQNIQLVNFWPNMELEEYIGLEQRVSGRMVLLDISATGEENLIEQQSGNPMKLRRHEPGPLRKIDSGRLAAWQPVGILLQRCGHSVFQICTLREMGTERERRQTIGRGLRLCVDQHGQRVHGFEVNRLTVIATESYEQFAENLQKEIEADTGIRFGVLEQHQFASIAIKAVDGTLTPLGVDQSKALWDHLKAAGYVDAKGKVQDSLKLALKKGTLTLPEAFEAQRLQIAEVLRKVSGRLEVKNADERRAAPLRKDKDGKAVYLSDEFKALWDRIKHHTTYRVQFDNAKLLNDCIAALKKAPAIAKARLQWRKADIAIGKAGVLATEKQGAATVVLDETDIELPDLLTDLQDRTQLTRRSIVTILTRSGRLDDFKRNPQQFIEQTAEIINRCKRLALVDGIKYQKIGDDHFYAQELFAKEELTGYLRNMLLDAKRSIFEHVIYESDTERAFADALEKNEGVVLYAKLPSWFKVPTPLGPYNPDWAILFDQDGAQRLYFVVETKSSLFTDDLRSKEDAKIECGRAHFAALGGGENPARYIVATSLDDVLKTMD